VIAATVCALALAAGLHYQGLRGNLSTRRLGPKVALAVWIVALLAVLEVRTGLP
jgi:epoxyqueuosine reductase QueG